MTYPVTYEWVLEQIDEYGDIYDIDHVTSLAELENRHTTYDAIGIQCDVWDSSMGTRLWAYIENDGSLSLPSHLKNAFETPVRTVPKRFHRELDRWRAVVRKSLSR